ncbi:hypothetical protein ABW20_dc0108365 [Dactylellina cionopaga]|nr:hypothetical protein ABW20_dc0108365 [Dactylellina cionopaga]
MQLSWKKAMPYGFLVLRLRNYVPSLTLSLMYSPKNIAQQPSSVIPKTLSYPTNAYGDYNRAFKRNPQNVQALYKPLGKRAGIKQREAKISRRQEDRIPLQDPKYSRWLTPPQDAPHQKYGCQRRRDANQGVQRTDISAAGNYLMWQLKYDDVVFVSQSTDTANPCSAVFCYYPWTMVAICNKRENMAERPVRILGRDIGRMVWEMSVYAGLDSDFITNPWEGGKRLCDDPESLQIKDALPESFVVWTSWSEDQWEVIVSKDSCDRLRGDPDWITTGKEKLPADWREDHF